jgi:CO/xanthine dehydrogenase FAD-binding subunit
VTHAQLARNPAVRRRAPVLAQASAAVGSVQVRNLGTLGGNVVNASVAADTLPALAALEARFETAGPGGPRALTAREFFVGPGRTALFPGELLSAVRIPGHPPHGCAFLKVGRRRAVAISRLSVAVLAEPSSAFARVAIGAVFPAPTRVAEAEEALRRSFDRTGCREAGRAAEESVRTVSGGRASMAYKLPVVRAAVERAAREALAAGGGGGP